MTLFWKKTFLASSGAIALLAWLLHQSTMEKFAAELMVQAGSVMQYDLVELYEKEEQEKDSCRSNFYLWIETANPTKAEHTARLIAHRKKLSAIEAKYKSMRDRIVAENNEFRRKVKYRLKTFDDSISPTSEERIAIEMFEKAGCKLGGMRSKEEDVILKYFLRASRPIP